MSLATVGTRQRPASRPSRPFYPAPLARCMAFLLQCFHKESIEKIKNMASGEFKIKFLQNTKWKRELKNRNREPHDLHKSSICCLGTEQPGLRGEGIPGCPGRGPRRTRGGRGALQNSLQAGSPPLLPQGFPILGFLVLLPFLSIHMLSLYK